MTSLHFPEQDRFGVSRARASTLPLPTLFALTFASAFTGAVVALFVQRYVQRHHMIEVLPSPAPIRHIGHSAEDQAASPASPAVRDTAPLLGPVAAKLTAYRTAELEQLVADHDDVMAGDGTMDCPASFPIKGNGRSGIYHWPGSSNYQQARPTLCFRSTDAAERAGFRPANR